MPAAPRSPRDVTIIGAGPAGTTAAIVLARRGWSVTLVEQHRFPREKVCGECLSALGLEVLRRLDLVLPSTVQPLTHAAVHAPGGRRVRLELPRPMCGVSRALLDGFLLDAARGVGAMVLQPFRCEALDPGPPPVVRLRDLSDNSVRELRPSWVLVADGKSALLNGGAPPPTRDFGIKAHFENVDGPRDTIELFGARGRYGGLAAIEGDRWNAAFSVPAESLRCHRGDVEAVFTDVVSDNPTLARRLAGARRVGRWLAAPLPRFAVRSNWPERVIPIGNAAAALEPIGGEGMGLAMRSAELAALAIDGRRTNAGDAGLDATLRQTFARLWRTRRASCRAAALLASSPAVADRVMPLARAFPVVARAALRLTGK